MFGVEHPNRVGTTTFELQIITQRLAAALASGHWTSLMKSRFWFGPNESLSHEILLTFCYERGDRGLTSYVPEQGNLTGPQRRAELTHAYTILRELGVASTLVQYHYYEQLCIHSHNKDLYDISSKAVKLIVDRQITLQVERYAEFDTFKHFSTTQSAYTARRIKIQNVPPP